MAEYAIQFKTYAQGVSTLRAAGLSFVESDEDVTMFEIVATPAQFEALLENEAVIYASEL